MAKKGKTFKKENCLLIATKNTPFSYIDAYKSTRANIENFAQENNIKTIMITSATEGVGKTNVIVNLALALSANGKNVVMIDCDMAYKGLTKYFNINSITAGLSNVLREQDSLVDVVYRVVDLGVYILPNGTMAPKPSGLLSSRNMRRVIRELEEDFDYVLIDTPAMQNSSFAIDLRNVAGGAILVAEHNQTKIKDIKFAKDELQKYGIKVIGSILNKYKNKS